MSKNHAVATAFACYTSYLRNITFKGIKMPRSKILSLRALITSLSSLFSHSFYANSDVQFSTFNSRAALHFELLGTSQIPPSSISRLNILHNNTKILVRTT